MEYTVSLFINVFDEQALYHAAVERAKEDEVEDYEALLGTPEEIEVANCLRMLLDPGVSPAGCEILDSSAE